MTNEYKLSKSIDIKQLTIKEANILPIDLCALIKIIFLLNNQNHFKKINMA